MGHDESLNTGPRTRGPEWPGMGCPLVRRRGRASSVPSSRPLYCSAELCYGGVRCSRRKLHKNKDLFR